MTDKETRSRRGRRSRRKGAVGERELAAEVERLFGVEARRGCQNAGGPDSPDVKHDLEGIHIECKRVERLSLYPAMEQAVKDAGEEDIPMVCHRKNHQPWLAVVRLDDLPELAVRLYLNAAKE